MRTLAAKGAGKIGRAALLQQDDADKKEANDDVHDDDEIEVKSAFFKLLSRSDRFLPGRRMIWCGGGDLNPYAFTALAPQASASANFATSALWRTL